ncbi:MAG: AAA family ATPase [Lutibacter sp.]|jgi:hypothetical protein
MARQFNVEQAQRIKVYPKIGIFSPSGGGKTFTSLRLATGMKQEVETNLKRKCEIWLANNEGSRGKYYANEFNYKITELEPPHEPEMYYDLIAYAEEYSKEKNVYVILIIDSLSKEWAGTGGCLDIVTKIGGTFQTGWKNVSPRHRRLMDLLVDSNLTIIATMRGEDQYLVETDANGKTHPVKLGVGAKQGKDFEYEFTCTFSLDQKTNCAESFKDNTHLFENKPTMKLTEQDGINLIKWANTSDIEPVKKPKVEETEDDPLINAKAKIKGLVDSLKDTGIDRNLISEAIKKHNIINDKPVENFNKVTDIKVARAIYKELETLAK